MSMAKTRNTFSRKTVAIAIASSVAAGCIGIPQAGATAGYKGGSFVPDESAVAEQHPNYNELPENEKEAIRAQYPIATEENLPTWGLQGGYYTDIKTPEGSSNGFSGRAASGYAASDVPNGYGPVQDLLTVKNKYQGNDRDLSTDAKKVLYVTYSIVKDIVENNGLSEETKNKLAAAGYSGDFGKKYVSTSPYFDGPYSFREAPVKKSELMFNADGEFHSGNTPITPADALSQTAAWIAGAAIAADTSFAKDGSQNGSTPATFDDIETVFTQIIGLGSRDDVSDLTGNADLGNAIIKLAQAVTDDDLANADLKFRFEASVQSNNEIDDYASTYYPIFFDIAASNPAPVEDLKVPVDDLHVTDVEKDKDGNYKVTRNDGESWIINLKDIRDKIADLEAKDSPTKEEFDKVKTDLDKILKEIEDLKAKDEALQNEIDKLKDDVKDINDRLNTIEKELDRLDGQDIKEVRDNGDGTYTLIRNNGDEVKGNIDTSGSVTNVTTDGKGNLVITIDGKDKVVPLDQVKVVEENAGTPNHTVTITTPDGKSVTFNVFDNYVTEVTQLEDGNYKVVRNDGTEWIINLKDIRDKIAALEAKESPTKEEFDKVKQELADLNLKVENEFINIDNRFTKVEGDITNLRNDLTALENRITKIEARLTKVEGHTDALTKCVAGAGMAGIPALLSIPLMVMTQLNIPGIKDLNTQIQKQIGMYNPELARAWERNGGVLQAGAVLAGLAGIIGGIAYVAKQCDPMMKTPAAQESDLGQLSSKVEKAKAKAEAGSSKKTEAEKTEQDAPAESAAEAEANTDAETATAPSEELVDAQ